MTPPKTTAGERLILVCALCYLAAAVLVPLWRMRHP